MRSFLWKTTVTGRGLPRAMMMTAAASSGTTGTSPSAALTTTHRHKSIMSSIFGSLKQKTHQPKVGPAGENPATKPDAGTGAKKDSRATTTTTTKQSTAEARPEVVEVSTSAFASFVSTVTGNTANAATTTPTGKGKGGGQHVKPRAAPAEGFAVASYTKDVVIAPSNKHIQLIPDTPKNVMRIQDAVRQGKAVVVGTKDEHVALATVPGNDKKAITMVRRSIMIVPTSPSGGKALQNIRWEKAINAVAAPRKSVVVRKRERKAVTVASRRA